MSEESKIPRNRNMTAKHLEKRGFDLQIYFSKCSTFKNGLHQEPSWWVKCNQRSGDWSINKFSTLLMARNHHHHHNHNNRHHHHHHNNQNHHSPSFMPRLKSPPRFKIQVSIKIHQEVLCTAAAADGLKSVSSSSPSHLGPGLVWIVG